MSTLLVGYDLNRPGQNYNELTTYLRSFDTWWHGLDSTWLIKTDASCKSVRDRCRALVDANDEVLVVDVTGRSSAWGGFDSKLSKWITDNL